MKPNIGIPKKKLKKTVTILNEILSNEVSLYIKTRKAHWNVSGESFMELHKMYEAQYKQIEESIDEIAERIGKLGQKTIGTMVEFLQHTSIKEEPGKYSSSRDTLKEILKDHETVILLLRKGADQCLTKNKDGGTSDILTGLMELHETNSWILRKYLTK